MLIPSDADRLDGGEELAIEAADQRSPPFFGEKVTVTGTRNAAFGKPTSAATSATAGPCRAARPRSPSFAMGAAAVQLLETQRKRGEG